MQNAAYPVVRHKVGYTEVASYGTGREITVEVEG